MSTKNVPHSKAVRCEVCGKSVVSSEAIPATFVRKPIQELIARDHPSWSASGAICSNDLNVYRGKYVTALLADEKGELSSLDREVVAAIHSRDILTEEADPSANQPSTFGERLSDRVASFGGSWTFIIFFGAVMATWITINTIALFTRPFDPYPYILLNLVLSCLAAIQAPIIMMSQNRQEAKDRRRAEHDYKINLKAELEVRGLHEKIDLLLTHQWQRLLEVQQVQMDVLEDLTKNTGKKE